MKTIRTKTLKDGRRALLKERRMKTNSESKVSGIIILSFDEMKKLFEHTKQRRKICKKFGRYAVHLSEDVTFLILDLEK